MERPNITFVVQLELADEQTPTREKRKTNDDATFQVILNKKKKKLARTNITRNSHATRTNVRSANWTPIRTKPKGLEASLAQMNASLKKKMLLRNEMQLA
jgi:hypothetical protein